MNESVQSGEQINSNDTITTDNHKAIFPSEGDMHMHSRGIPRNNQSEKSKLSGRALFRHDIVKLEGREYYGLKGDDRQVANYMVHNGYMTFSFGDLKSTLTITERGRNMMKG